VHIGAVALLLAALTHGAAPVRAADSGVTPAQLITAYNISPLQRQHIQGQGQTLAFIEVDGLDQSDLDSFDATFHLPSTQVDVYVPQGTNGQLAPGQETTLDVEYAHAIAPAARLQVYEVIKSGDFQGYSRHLAQAIQGAVDNGAQIISLSLRGTGNIICSTFLAKLFMHSTIKKASDSGVALFAASGDYGDHPCQSSNAVGSVYPASDPDVTAVGGSTLTLTRSGAYGHETAWSGSGGGISTNFPRPSWQMGSSSFGKYRSVPDVAFDADPHSGVPIYFQGQWLLVGGTSLGAPCWAAIWALATQYHQQRTGKTLGYANPLLYALANSARRAAVFHDVTAGSNGSYRAGPGWDDVTGWGSPNVYNLVRALTP
jgi:kumamolisin